jgi:hypothetical protein
MNNDIGASRRGVKVGAKWKNHLILSSKEMNHHLPMVGPWLIGTAKPSSFRLTFSMGTTAKVLRATSLDPRMFCSFTDAKHEFSKHFTNLWFIYYSKLFLVYFGIKRKHGKCAPASLFSLK